ncbi:MAG: tRNA (guanosine(37)-N1)-methyltransferase TrmD [Clostridia bacterium]|nr:tRNA (guanosine(37)-N1)-methyltransferase TrmD [Clostridia bacterium]
MQIDILTLFPDMFTPLNESIIGRAVEAGKVEIRIHDIRDYTTDKHKKCDDYPFGGGAGMLMMPQPIASAIEAIDPDHKARRIYMSPKGRTFSQKLVPELISYPRLLLLCGHYEGVDQRVLDMFIDEEISIGDYVLTGGELPAMVVTDAVCRYLDGVISSESLAYESFSDEGLEYPQYTRPREFMGVSVPEVLVSGNHGEVDKWRKEQSRIITEKLRPDLIKKEDGE